MPNKKVIESKKSWCEFVVKILPVLAIAEVIFIVASQFSPYFAEDLTVSYGYIPLVHEINSFLYLPSSVGIIFYFMVSELLPFVRNGFGASLSGMVNLLTSLWILIIWGIFVAYILAKRRRTAWYLLIFSSLITIFNIATALYVYSYFHLIISVVSLVIIVALRKIYTK